VRPGSPSPKPTCVEVDSYAFHSTRNAFDRDRRRDADLAAQGLRLLRLTWSDVGGDGVAAVAALARALYGRPSDLPRSSAVSA
jgi:hypothetical protein